MSKQHVNPAMKPIKTPAKMRGVTLLLALILPISATQAQTRSKPAKPIAAAGATGPAPTSSTCGEEDALPSSGGRSAYGFETTTTDPRSQLQDLVQIALQRSQTTGAATLLAQAARDDWEEAQAAKLPRVALTSSVGYSGDKTDEKAVQNGLQGRLAVNLSTALYTSGRIEQLAAWRGQLAESSRFGLINAEQQIALQVVAQAMDRGRYQLQIQVWGQYVRRMACLVEALENIVRVDRGRASELVQAQKTRQQTDLQLEQTQSALRQTEIRLRRFVGDNLPPSASYSTLLNRVPDLEQMQADVLMAAEVNQLAAQARAQLNYANSVAAAQKPQVNLSVQSSATAVLAQSGSANSKSKAADWTALVNFSMPIYEAGADYGISAARRRAEAAKLQREDAIESRRYRIAEVHEAATASFDRARNIVEILRNSDRLRASTLQQWQQLGRRSLFDVMGTEADYYSQRIAQVNALFDGQQAVALMWSMGKGVMEPLR